jgi:hypothetical protein
VYVWGITGGPKKVAEFLLVFVTSGHFMGNNIVLDVFRSEICEVEHGLLDDLLCFYPGGEQVGA